MMCYQLSGNSGSCSWGPHSPSLRAQSLASSKPLVLPAIVPSCFIKEQLRPRDAPGYRASGFKGRPVQLRVSTWRPSPPPGPVPGPAPAVCFLGGQPSPPFVLPLLAVRGWRRCPPAKGGCGGPCTGCYLLSSPWFLPGLGGGGRGARYAGGEDLARKGT